MRNIFLEFILNFTHITKSLLKGLLIVGAGLQKPQKLIHAAAVAHAFAEHEKVRQTPDFRVQHRGIVFARVIR